MKKIKTLVNDVSIQIMELINPILVSSYCARQLVL